MRKITYRERAEAFAPKTAEEIARAAKDLAANGYSYITIAAILKVDTNFIPQLIGRRTVTQSPIY